MIMTNNVINVSIQNDLTYLFIQWLGWDYNFLSVLFADIILIAAFFGIIFVIGFICILLKWWNIRR